MIQAAVDNNVALEINATAACRTSDSFAWRSRWEPRFTFGTNNFDDKPIDMTRCFESIDLYGLKSSDMYVPAPREIVPRLNR